MNKLDNPVEQMAKATYHAVNVALANTVSLVDDVEVYQFPQTWGSTALGFGGIGGQSMTTAYTTVVSDSGVRCAVYFGGRHAYTIEKANQQFWLDVFAFTMCEVKNAHSRYER